MKWEGEAAAAAKCPPCCAVLHAGSARGRSSSVSRVPALMLITNASLKIHLEGGRWLEWCAVALLALYPPPGTHSSARSAGPSPLIKGRCKTLTLSKA